jgi:serine/threonine protein kinase
MQGSRYGQYELESFLGGGGQGDVWLAHDEKMGRKVAIKKLKPEVIDDADVRRRFDVEAETLIQINEPHVVRVLDRIEIDGMPALVQDYMEGGSVADLNKATDEP